jgi:Coenzyme PQQ synthesis protein D (PqqD)
MDDGAHYRLNQGTAAGKVMDGEAIVINAVTGRYYSLDDAACVAWVHLAAGAPLPSIVESIVTRYEVDPIVAESDLRALAQELVEQDLLVLGAPVVEASVDESELPDQGEGRRPYATPVVEAFTDMEELLAFDPPLPVAEQHDWEWRAG